MPPVPRPSFYTLRTTVGRQITIYVPPDGAPWQAATQYARASFVSDSQLAELRIAAEAEMLSSPRIPLRPQPARSPARSRACRPDPAQSQLQQ